jgi:hypothetical protein
MKNSRIFWIDHIKKWKNSNLTQTEYCRAHNLKKGTFSSMKVKLVREGHIEKSNNELAQLTNPFIDLKATPTVSPFTIELPNNIKLRFDTVPDPKWLGKVFGELNANQC